ncbi:MAG: hypothetical protein WC640_02760 [Candidatus Paceibacterota bacterium]|jgi:hypothetical protein
MQEEIKGSLTPEEQEHEDEERRLDWLARHPDPKIASGEALNLVAAEFRELVASFESRHPLDYLLSISDLSPGLGALWPGDADMTTDQIERAISELVPEDVARYRARTAAKKDLEPITEILKIFPGGHEEYKRLSRVVGIKNGNKIDHDR